MICNIDYYDPTNDQFILKNVALSTSNPKKYHNDKNIIKLMLNNFNNNIEGFGSKTILNNYNIIFLLLLLLIFIKYYIM